MDINKSILYMKWLYKIIEDYKFVFVKLQKEIIALPHSDGEGLVLSNTYTSIRSSKQIYNISYILIIIKLHVIILSLGNIHKNNLCRLGT